MIGPRPDPARTNVGKQRPRCERNASNTMAAGALIGGAALGTGIPLIVVGKRVAVRILNHRF